MRDALSSERHVLVAPSILSADSARLGEEAAHALGDPPGGAGAELLHIDVMDGHFVPNLTMGPAIVASLRRALPEACLDVHLMVTDPVQYIDAFARAGADHLTFHIEPSHDERAGAGMAPLSEGYEAIEVARRVREAGMGAGLALNPGTPAAEAREAIDSGLFSMILVMSVHPGFSGQSFIEESLETTRAVREMAGAYAESGVRVQMDGGIKPANAGACRSAGCDVLVAASAVFDEPPERRAGVVEALRGV